MWQRSAVEESKEYQVALCQAPDGRRTHALHPTDSSHLPEHAVFLTTIVPTSLLLAGDLKGISKAVLLNDGKHYWVDAHGLWLTLEELDALENDQVVPWVNGIAPPFAPK